jgi:AcrR family transcriptional regulator
MGPYKPESASRLSSFRKSRLTRNEYSFTKNENSFILCNRGFTPFPYRRRTALAYRHTAKVEQQQADRRAAILAATRWLVSDAGFRGTQIAGIAESAGVATGTVYRYFASKADLFAELVATVSAQEVGIVQAIAAAEGGPVTRLGDALTAFATRAVHSHTLAYAMIAEPVEPSVERVRLEFRRKLVRVIQGLVEEGMAAGDLPPQDAAICATGIVGACMEALVGPLAPDLPRRAAGGDDLIAKITAFCLRGTGHRAMASGSGASN